MFLELTRRVSSRWKTMSSNIYISKVLLGAVQKFYKHMRKCALFVRQVGPRQLALDDVEQCFLLVNLELSRSSITINYNARARR